MWQCQAGRCPVRSSARTLSPDPIPSLLLRPACPGHTEQPAQIEGATALSKASAEPCPPLAALCPLPVASSPLPLVTVVPRRAWHRCCSCAGSGGPSKHGCIVPSGGPAQKPFPRGCGQEAGRHFPETHFSRPWGSCRLTLSALARDGAGDMSREERGFPGGRGGGPAMTPYVWARWDSPVCCFGDTWSAHKSHSGVYLQVSSHVDTWAGDLKSSLLSQGTSTPPPPCREGTSSFPITACRRWMVPSEPREKAPPAEKQDLIWGNEEGQVLHHPAGLEPCCPDSKVWTTGSPVRTERPRPPPPQERSLITGGRAVFMRLPGSGKWEETQHTKAPIFLINILD